MRTNTLLLVCTLMLGLGSLQAQVGKGFFAGGSIDGFYSRAIGNPGHSWGIGTTVKSGYYFTDRWAVGLSGTAKYQNSYYLQRSDFYSGGLFLRYAQPIAMDGRLMLWGEYHANIGVGNSYTLIPAGRRYLYDGTSFSTGLSAGLLVMPKKYLGIEFGIGSIINYSYQLDSKTYPDSKGQSGLSIFDFRNMSPQVGVHYYFNR
jgi:hypothetical protein